MIKVSSTLPPKPLERRYVVWVLLLIVMILSVVLKSQYYLSKPYLPDGDTYFHGMLVNYIVDNHTLTTTVPYEVPGIGHGYPFSFHILMAQIHYLTGWSVLSILRWFGPVMSAIIVLGVFTVTSSLTKSRIAAIVAALMTLFVPLLSGRLSSTFPENIVVLFMPMLIWMLVTASSSSKRRNLLAGGILVISAVGFHYSSYLLIPTYCVGVFVYYLGKRWKKRNVLWVLAWTIFIFGTIVIVFSQWWLFGFLQSFLSINSGAAIATTGSIYARPAPDSTQWYAQLGYVTLVLGFLGAIYSILSKEISWRTKAILGTFILTILLPLQILPSLNLFSYTPYRAFVYLAIPLVILVGVLIANIKTRTGALVITGVIAALYVSIVPNQHTAGAVGAGEQQLTIGEYAGIHWLEEHTSQNSIVFSAPANGRQIAFFTRRTTAYDSAPGVFFAKTSAQAITEIKLLGNYPTAYIYISKYKLGPVYNFGWVRDYAYVNANLKKFKDGRFFSTVFEDNDSIIFQANPNLLTQLTTPPVDA